MVFPVVTYRSENFLVQGLNPVIPNCRQILYHPSQQGSPCRCENWTIKQAEHQKIDAFKLWCWIRVFRIPWTARRSSQSILKEINSEYSLKGLILKLILQSFGHLMWRANSLEKPWFWERLGAGGKGSDRRWDGWMASPIQWTWVWANSGRWWRTRKPGVLQSKRTGYN